MAEQLDIKQPDVTVGFAMVDTQGGPFVDTVCSTERGAMINALFTVFGAMPRPDWSDAKVANRFRTYARDQYQISAVAIERLIVVDDKPETSK